MNVSQELRLEIRKRAKFACEYCTVTEDDTGSELTIDHFQPITKGGSDESENLIYCCQRCNQYKADYWPTDEMQPALWNPRQDTVQSHFVLLENEILAGLTNSAKFSIQRLRLNRAPLVAYRRNKRQLLDETRLIEQYLFISSEIQHLQIQVMSLAIEQNNLLEQQRQLLKLFLQQKKH